jgi:hypothetical protein
MTTADSLADSFRKAVASGEYARASGLWTKYAAALKPTLLERNAAAVSALANMKELMSWARTTVMVANCIAAKQLNALDVQRRYAALPGAGHSTIGVSG